LTYDITAANDGSSVFFRWIDLCTAIDQKPIVWPANSVEEAIILMSRIRASSAP
jgi:hypothetical protein